MKLALGTVQFGQSYGVSNKLGQPSLSEIRAILQAAQSRVDLLDTAAVYGESEERLGQCAASVSGFKIVTKTVPLRKEQVTDSDIEAVDHGFQRSLERLRANDVYCLMVHHADDLLVPGGEKLWSWLLNQKKLNRAQKIGVSVYSGRQIDGILSSFDMDVIQLPVSYLDQRLIRSGHMDRLIQANIEVHLRSIFLQGLLLMTPQEIPDSLGSVRAHLSELHKKFATAGVTPLEAALAFCRTIPVDRVIVGVNSVVELDQVLSAWASLDKKASGVAGLWRESAWHEESVLNPGQWPSMSGGR